MKVRYTGTPEDLPEIVAQRLPEEKFKTGSTHTVDEVTGQWLLRRKPHGLFVAVVPPPAPVAEIAALPKAEEMK